MKRKTSQLQTHWILAIIVCAIVIFFIPRNQRASHATSSPQDPNATLPAPKKTAPTNKSAQPTKKRPTSRRPGPSKPTSEFVGIAIVLTSATGEGTISGKITWTGAAPRFKIDTSADPVCSEKNPNLITEDIVVSGGRVANVFVYLEDGTTADGKKLGDLSFDVPTNEVVLDQSGCRFVPHVLGIQANQKLKITNSDATIYNVHFMPRNNPEWNQTQPIRASPIEHIFSYPEVERPFPVKDNQHPWMKAYIGVLSHPFYAVSNLDGSFEIRGVPPGTYRLAAWHEACSALSEETIFIEVTVRPKSNASVANISGLRIGKDKNLSQETSDFGPNDPIYAVATVSNAQGKVKARGQLIIEDVPGLQAGPLPGVEKTLNLPGSGTATYTFTPPLAGWPKGKYRIEVILIDDKGEQKDQKAIGLSVS